uniref:Extended-spectrum beta-lactamase n=1 Tax=Escherichia coli TaxID=562 RepID=A0A7I8HP36_ECOLX|nr:extended-spectrum beta-lactamase [Escherichia coli]
MLLWRPRRCFSRVQRKSSCLISLSRSSLPIWLPTIRLPKNTSTAQSRWQNWRGRVAVQRQYRHEQIHCPARWPGRRAGFCPRDRRPDEFRLDRTQPTLNTAIPGDPRDTTTHAGDGADVASAYAGSCAGRNPAGAVGDVAQRQYDRRSQHSGRLTDVVDCGSYDRQRRLRHHHTH